MGYYKASRVCKSCSKRKGIDEFNIHSKGKQGTHYKKTCKECEVVPFSWEDKAISRSVFDPKSVIETGRVDKNDLTYDEVIKALTDLQHSTWRTSGRDKDRPQMWKDMASGIAHAIQYLQQINNFK